MAHVELEDLHKSYAGKIAVRGFSLGIEQGEFVSLLGPSGCGKTTTLRIIAGFEVPDSGAVRVGAEDLLAIPPHRRGMGVVFQNYALFPHLTAANNIAFGMRIAGRPSAEVRRRVLELLALVGLDDAGSKYPREMSGGQQQRIALARALAIEPRMLLLDEPLSALDAVVRVSLRDEIRRIQTTLGVTTLYVTHDQEEALAISDRIVVMREGRIEQVGTAEDIYARPASRFVAGFIGKMNQIAGEVAEPGRGHVRCGKHTLCVSPQALAGVGAGASVTVLVRPEAIGVESGEAPMPADANRLRARIEAITFLGAIRRLGLDADGQRMVADVSTASGSFARGDAVSLTFAPEACRILTDDGPAKS
jgi:putative spermidine/putrescine transport system ATP-binding protein